MKNELENTNSNKQSKLTNKNKLEIESKPKKNLQNKKLKQASKQLDNSNL